MNPNRALLNFLQISSDVPQAKPLAWQEENSFLYAPLGMALIDLKGHVIGSNPALCGLLGYKASELVGTTVGARTHPADREHDQVLFKRLASGEFDFYELERRLQRRNGTTLWAHIHCSLVRSPSGAPAHVIVQYVDIDMRKLAERELLRKTAAIEDLYQHAPCGYHSLDADGHVVHINDTELDWLGYTREEVVRRMNALDLLHPSCHEAFSRQFAKLEKTGQLRDVELELIRKDGSVLPVLLSSTGIFEPNGHFKGTRTVLTDNSVRKQLEKERVAHLDHLAELSHHLVEVQENERRQLAAELHDRASPNLAALDITLANLALMLPHPMRDAISTFLEDAHALLKDTTNGIREICTDLRPAALDYAGLVPALHDYARQFGRRNGIAVDLDTDRFNVKLPPDTQSHLFRIAQEALTNCAKHASASAVCIELASDHSRMTLSVSDNGNGFDPDKLGTPGSTPGLGLITMRERAEFAGGRMTIESWPGMGTRVSVVFD